MTLAQASHQGIDAQWWMLVPRGELPTWFENKDGKVQLDLGITPQGEYAKANHADERGVIQHIYWELALDIPKRDQLPSINEIASSVHSDLSDLGAFHETASLNMGVEDVGGTSTGRYGAANSVSMVEFAKTTLEHWQWWERGDVDFQLKNGATSDVNELGGGTRPAVMVDYYSVVDVTVATDQGNVMLEKGIMLKGQVIDKNSRGVAKTVVGIRKTENRIMHACAAIIGTAVKTDESGYFQLPALSGAYQLSVEGSVPDYSRQMMLNGETPPSINPMTFEFDRSIRAENILLQEQTP